MNGGAVAINSETVVFPKNKAEIQEVKIEIFEKKETEKFSVSENETKIQGTRFARLKKSLRKRSASIF